MKKERECLSKDDSPYKARLIEHLLKELDKTVNIIFFNSHTFLTREISNALRKKTEHQLIVVTIPQYPLSAQVSVIFERLSQYLPALVILVNNAGCDYEGVLIGKLAAADCIIANWYHDYPFYEEIFQNRIMVPHPNRIDFVSEESFLPELKKRRFKSHFLPLATDPAYFNTDGEVEVCRDVAFVGNSSSEFLDSIINEESEEELQKILSLQVDLKKRYYANPQFNIHEYLESNPELWRRKTSINERKLLFILEWLIGYFYRRDFISEVAKRYGAQFTCFGDPYWNSFIDVSQVSSQACYYTTLSHCYRSSRINLNINRIQIRTSFTQRIFDCAASGAFLLTDQRDCNDRYFCTSEPDRELVQFKSLEHCCDLIDYYLAHEDEREQITEAARKKVLKYHTYDNRIEEMLTMCKKELGV